MVEEVHEISKRGELLIAVTSGAVVTLVKSVVGGDGIALERVEAVISTLAKRDGVRLEVVAVFIISVHVAVAMTREVLRKASDHLRALTNAVHFFCLVMDDVGSREVALAPQCIAGV